MAQPGYPKQSKPKAPMKPKAPKMSPSKKRRILEAEGQMQQGQTGSVGPPIDVSASISNEGKDAGFSSDVKDKDKAFGMKKGRSVKKKKKGYAMGGALKGGQKKLDRNDDGKISGDDFKMMKKKGGGMMKKKGYAMGGMMKKKGMKKGGKVRGSGIARQGVRAAIMV